ncbi:bifunctional (p)ppGpp synthetase/guanosine-3',5'-bis(diphosphate) 3'-pyrophosphohydrolase [Candidatus Uhrbacteria bacterium]|nr:bifunctional (p)ppGpp synthetase/guanosine-3',5'-bis(diphosphate) 3'-pyrophosphohydrolase [Candidatus Uhrbacteria bacterium]
MLGTLEGLLGVIAENYPSGTDASLVERAYQFARAAHEGQMRLTGEPYITHPTITATKLAAMKLPLAVVAAGLLHDVPEDTSRTSEEIRAAFGDDIANMVEGVTKLGKVKFRGMDRYVENLRKMFYAMAEDIRTIYIKFADRLHNLETLSAQPIPKRERIAREVLEIYAPIANRLGMGEFKGAFEDLAFQYLEPKKYQTVKALRDKILRAREGVLSRMIDALKKDLLAEDLQFVSAHGRMKHLYSLHQKLERHDNDIARIYDLIAIRVIVKKIPDCYTVLGIVHNRWKPLKGRIKDYVAQPKPNGYQSIHTTIFGDDGMIVEVQVRTEEMHELAEYGPARHWQYKEGSVPITKLDTRWINELVKVQKELTGKEEFLEHLEDLKLDAFRDRIFVFTPKGDVIDLAEGSTPIDFAYAIHSEIGNKCVAARVNDQMVQLDAPLKSGDLCEIVIDKNRKGPNPDWMDFVKSRHARTKIKDGSRSTIRQWLKSKFDKSRERKIKGL